MIPTGQCACTTCGGAFVPQYAYQQVATPNGRAYLCSQACRDAFIQRATASLPPAEPAPVRIAVLNQKGGVGKTTTAVSLAAGLAERGVKTLLVDADAQGSVGMSLGVRGQKTLYHVLVEGVPPADAAVPVRKNLDVITANDSLSHAEIRLAQNPKRAGVLTDILGTFKGYSFVIVDCAPALSLLNVNVLCFAEQVLVPVSCDYLSLVALQQLLKTIKHVQSSLAHNVQLGGVLPTMYDGRSKHAQSSLKSLRDHFGARALPPVRACIRLKEAPSEKRTIFEHAPDSTGAQDYARVVEWALALAPVQASAPADWSGTGDAAHAVRMGPTGT